MNATTHRNKPTSQDSLKLHGRQAILAKPYSMQRHIFHYPQYQREHQDILGHASSPPRSVLVSAGGRSHILLLRTFLGPEAQETNVSVQNPAAWIPDYRLLLYQSIHCSVEGYCSWHRVEMSRNPWKTRQAPFSGDELGNNG